MLLFAKARTLSHIIAGPKKFETWPTNISRLKVAQKNHTPEPSDITYMSKLTLLASPPLPLLLS